MKRTTYQVPELRDENDNIIQQGAFGKNTALANSTNDGWIDYVANDLMYLYNNTMGGTGGEINTETITGQTGTITTLTATTVKAGTVTADALSGPLTGNVTGDLNGNVTGDVTGNLTGNVTGTADKAVADGKGNNIVNTYVTKSDLSSSVSTTSLTVSGETSVPTANAGNSSKAIANTAYVQGELTNYLPLSGGTLTGVVNGVTPTAGDNSTKIATTEFVNAKAGNYLPLSGGTVTGLTVTGETSVPTANAGNSSKAIANTEFVAKSISALAEKVAALNYSNAGAHNSIYRGKYLGGHVTDEQYDAIDAGTFEDLFIGDYWKINGVNWRIAAFDYWLHCGDTECTTHHVVIVPDTNLATCQMNNSNVTTGAYIGSDYYTGANSNTGKATADTAINNAFGSSHILTHRESLANAVTNGYESAGSWYDSKFELMTEVMVYGGTIFHNIVNGTNVPYSYNIDKSQLPLFALEPSRITNRANWWLRDVVFAASFAAVNYNGNANGNGASDSLGVRPAFAIKK